MDQWTPDQVILVVSSVTAAVVTIVGAIVRAVIVIKRAISAHEEWEDAKIDEMMNGKGEE